MRHSSSSSSSMRQQWMSGRARGRPRLILITSLNLIPYDKWYKSTTLESPAIRCSPICLCLWRRLPPFLPTQATRSERTGGQGTDMGISFTRGGIMFWWWHVFLHTKYANAKKRKIFMKLPQNSQANVVKSWKIRFFLCYTQGARLLFFPPPKNKNTSGQITMLARRTRRRFSLWCGWWVQETARYDGLVWGPERVRRRQRDIYTTLNICQHSTQA